MHLLLAYLQTFIAAAKALLIPVSNLHRTVWAAEAKPDEAAQSLFNINLSSCRKSGYRSDCLRDLSSPLGGRSFASTSSVPDWY